MNRQQRRRHDAMAAHAAKNMQPARPDRRPLYYDVGGGDRVQCYLCLKQGLHSKYKVGEAAMSDPANPPDGEPKGSMFTICKHHLPENAVIYNPRNNYCRNKVGDEWWEEGNKEEIPDALRKVI